MRGDEIGDEGVAALDPDLVALWPLQSLDLGDNCSGADGATVLGSHLRIFRRYRGWACAAMTSVLKASLGLAPTEHRMTSTARRSSDLHDDSTGKTVARCGTVTCWIRIVMGTCARKCR
jgi:hypothetical protein